MRKAAFRAEQEQLRLSLLKRAELFLKEARAIALPVCPFDSGFFVTVPTEKAEEVAAELRKSDLFVVPLGEKLAIPFFPPNYEEVLCKPLYFPRDLSYFVAFFSLLLGEFFSYTNSILFYPTKKSAHTEPTHTTCYHFIL